MTLLTQRLAATAALVVLLLAGCSGDEPEARSPATSSTAAPTSGATTTSGPGRAEPRLDRVSVRLVEVAQLEQPVASALRPGDDAIYVAEKTGRVVAVRDGRPDPDPVLDLRGQVSTGSEQGLLGVAFSPDGDFLYADYTNEAGDTRVVEWRLRDGRADPSSRRELLAVDQPFSNHNGGQLAVRPDGTLWIAFGDGGSGGDPEGNAQSLDTLLGKIVRIDPRNPSGGRPYGIPEDNPFVDRDGARPEIWDYGLRNPWRFSFDSQTGDLWIADVGQSRWEEVNFEPAGSDGGVNYGWDRREGRHRYEGERPEGAVDPVIEYGREGGACTVIGGTVYRGQEIPDLRGAYLYGDFCAGWVRAAVVVDGEVEQERDLGIVVPQLSSFGAGPDGELYAFSLTGTMYRISPT